MTASAAPVTQPTQPAGRPPVMNDLLRRLDWLRHQREVLLAIGVAAVIGLATGLGLALSAGSMAPPDTAAARLVPADALAYMNVSLDRRRPEVAQALRLASRLPGFSLTRSLVEARVGALFGFSGAPPRWVGDEAALAVVPGLGGFGSRADSLALLAVRRARDARRYLSGLATSVAVYDGRVVLHRLSSGSYVAQLGRYLVAGQEASVRQAVDVSRGAVGSLASSSVYQRAASGEPAGRVLDLYAPASGITALLSSRTGPLGAVRELLSGPGLSAASASLSTAPGGLRLQVHRVFGSGAGRAAGRPVDGSILARVPAGTGFATEVPSLTTSAPGLLASSAQIGVGSAIGPLLTRLGKALHAEGFDVSGVLSVFNRPTVVAVTATGGRPDLLVLTRTSDPRQARIALANIAPSLAALFPASSSGLDAAPLFTGRQIDGVTIHQLQLGPGLQLNYTVFHHLVGVSTSVAALVSLAHPGASLGRSSRFRTAFGQSGTPAGSLVFADLKVLIRLGEQTGLLHGPGFARLAPDLNRISVIGLRARSNRTESTSELYIKIP